MQATEKKKKKKDPTYHKNPEQVRINNGSSGKSNSKRKQEL